MNIPKKAIEKAFEGGWRPHNGTDYSGYKIKKVNKRAGYYLEKGNASSFLDLFHTALDLLFWQALCKGWADIQNEDYSWCPAWLYWAGELNTVILTNGDTDKFWADLLASK